MAQDAVNKQEALRWARRLFGENVVALEVWFSRSTDRCQLWLLYDYGGGRMLGAGGSWQQAVDDSCRVRREAEGQA